MRDRGRPLTLLLYLTATVPILSSTPASLGYPAWDISRVIDVGTATAHGPMNLCRCLRFTRVIFTSSLDTCPTKFP
ncbi:hypothetical protein BGY98DRAFT_1000393 [Russula aff. rugulosa BPL654]|nr:hypothetical protein BGY98DRAFT_1000393 [Russula aff. rugulosa BPL654]